MNSPHRQSSDAHRPKVSVIMPAFNGEQYIAQSIRSVLNQSVSGWELIIVDDGSSDRTAEIVAEFQKTDDRVRYFRQRNAGQAAARNQGITRSRGNLIAFLDQDDLWLANKLEIQIKTLEEAGVDVVFSNGYIFSGEDVDSAAMCFPEVQGTYTGDEMFRLLFLENRIPILTALLRKQALTNAGGLNEDLRYQNVDDYDLWLRLAAHGSTFLGLAEKLARYRSHPGQASTNVAKMLKAELAVLKKHERTNRLGDDDKARRFRSVYGNLVRALVNEGGITEARSFFKELLARRPVNLSILSQGCLLWLMPGSYGTILDLAGRARESICYRIGRPMRRLLK